MQYYAHGLEELYFICPVLRWIVYWRRNGYNLETLRMLLEIQTKWPFMIVCCFMTRCHPHVRFAYARWFISQFSSRSRLSPVSPRCYKLSCTSFLPQGTIEGIHQQRQGRSAIEVAQGLGASPCRINCHHVSSVSYEPLTHPFKRLTAVQCTPESLLKKAGLLSSHHHHILHLSSAPV